MANIFLSYTSRDRARARVVADGLESLGWTVWWDRKLVPGEPYPKDIEDQLATAGCVVTLWSARSVQSDWVQREAAGGQQRNVLVPALIDDIAGKLPKAFNEIHASRLTNWEGDTRDPQFVALHERIAALVGTSPAPRAHDRRRVFQQFRRQVISAFRVPAWPPQLVLGDWIVAGLLIAATAVQVGWAWRLRFNGGEKWLWGTALVAAAWVWYLARRVSLRPRWRSAPVAFLMMMGRIALIVGITAAWSYAARNLYATAPFSSDVSGFYVARLDGDPQDKFQSAIIDSLRSFADSIKLPGHAVRRLPERVSTDERARVIGNRGKAALVFWGKVSPSSSGARVTAHVAILRDEGMYESSRNVSSAVVGADIPEVPFTSELATAQRALTLFFAGYANYHGGDRDAARAYFDSTRSVLEASHGKADGIAPIDGTLGSVRFYLGNLSARRGDTDAAIAHYRAAIEHTRHPVTPGAKFVEPLNNLAFLLIRQHRADSAVGYLREALSLCGAGAAIRSSCPYVRYNVGVAFNDLEMYDSAIVHLKGVATAGSDARGPQAPRLLAFALQQIAYALVKQADGIDDATQRSALYGSAGRALDESERGLVQSGTDSVPASFEITRARILAGTARWTDMITLLTSDRVRKLGDPNALLLLAFAHHCARRPDASSSSLDAYMNAQNDRTEQQAGLDWFGRMIQRCSPLQAYSTELDK